MGAHKRSRKETRAVERMNKARVSEHKTKVKVVDVTPTVDHLMSKLNIDELVKASKKAMARSVLKINRSSVFGRKRKKKAKKAKKKAKKAAKKVKKKAKKVAKKAKKAAKKAKKGGKKYVKKMKSKKKAAKRKVKK